MKHVKTSALQGIFHNLVVAYIHTQIFVRKQIFVRTFVRRLFLNPSVKCMANSKEAF